MKRSTWLKGKTQKLLTALTSTILRCKAFRNQLWCFIIFLRFHILFKRGKITPSKKIFVHFSITQYTKNQAVSAENVSIYLLFKSLSYKTFSFPLCICCTGIKDISPVKQFMGICIYIPELYRARSNFGKASFRSSFPEYTNNTVTFSLLMPILEVGGVFCKILFSFLNRAVNLKSAPFATCSLQILVQW